MNIRSESFGRLPELDPMRDSELIATLRAWPATAIHRTAAELGPHRTARHRNEPGGTALRAEPADPRPGWNSASRPGGRRPRAGLQSRSLKVILRKLWHLGDVRILVVEDEEPLAEAIARGLRREGMAVDVALNGDDGHEKATITRYDVVLLDRDLPGMSGDELCREIVTSGELTRVLMLTASSAVSDRVEGLSLGADDYLAKPFAFPELVARVRALGRRATPAAPPMLTAGDVELDPAKRTVRREWGPIDLTRKEFGVLEVLLSADGSVVSSEELLERVWDENADPFTTTVRVTVMTLRKKLGEPGIIETVVGSGYRVPNPGTQPG
jgi:DNA-binding response OmpR family regulator